MDEAVRRYYVEGRERERLGSWSWLEFARTKELLARFLPAAPIRILDVGGGPGGYASWLAGEGYDVHLVDPIPLHVEQALEAAAAQPGARLAAAVGDARALTEADVSFDVVLLLGPLYHLTARDDRLAALREARRVIRPGGSIAVAAISRFASLLDGLAREMLGDPEFAAIVRRDLREGQHRNPAGHAGWFTTAFFHHPDELAAEIADADLSLEGIYAVEGPAGLFAPDLPPEDTEARERLLWAGRAVEQEPTLIGASAHILAIARRGAGIDPVGPAVHSASDDLCRVRRAGDGSA